jgi:hypothetical protein
MLIKTSYFANLRNIDITKVVPVSIALYTPKWYTGLSYKKVGTTKITT